MTFKRDEWVISVHQMDGFGKRPALWIGKQSDTENWLGKVASFGSQERADDFCEWLEHLLNLKEDK